MVIIKFSFAEISKFSLIFINYVNFIYAQLCTCGARFYIYENDIVTTLLCM